MKKMSIFALLLAAVLVTSYSVSGTYAKYTSIFEGETATARVAKWAFAINDTDLTTAANDFEFNLFDTILDEDGIAETDIVPANSDKVIAPGTKGSFAIKLANNSEVNAEYTVDYTVANTANIPVEFNIAGTDVWSKDLADVTATAINSGADTTITINWRWTYATADRTATEYTSTTDETDTALGEVGTNIISVKADIVVTQVN